MEQLLIDSRIAEMRAAADRADTERAIRELYGASEEADRRVDPALFARYIWSGLHLPART